MLTGQQVCGMGYVNDTWKWFNDVFCSLNYFGRKSMVRAMWGENAQINEHFLAKCQLNVNAIRCVTIEIVHALHPFLLWTVSNCFCFSLCVYEVHTGWTKARSCISVMSHLMISSFSSKLVQSFLCHLLPWTVLFFHSYRVILFFLSIFVPSSFSSSSHFVGLFFPRHSFYTFSVPWKLLCLQQHFRAFKN